MPRAKKQPKYEYGIEITKPWSQEMYAHNNKVLEIAKQNVQTALDKAYAQWEPEAVVDDQDDICKIAREICGYIYGPGHENQEVYEDACRELHNSSYHFLHEFYSFFVDKGWCAPLEQGFVGYSK